MRANGFSPRHVIARSAARRGYLAAIVAAVLLSIPVFAGLTFIPDSTFSGSSLKGWHLLGEAAWRAHDGEITGTASQSGAGGWLFLDQSYQEVGLHALFRCTGGCQAGVLIQAQKTPEGYKGIFVSLNEDNVPSYDITELHRERLRSIGGLTRVAPPPAPAAEGRGGGGRGTGRGAGGRSGNPIVLPITRPSSVLKPNDWNQIEIFLDANRPVSPE